MVTSLRTPICKVRTSKVSTCQALALQGWRRLGSMTPSSCGWHTLWTGVLAVWLSACVDLMLAE